MIENIINEVQIDLAYASAEELVSLIHNKQITSEELLDFYLQRIKQFNGKINAVIEINENQARKRAKKADEDLKNGIVWGPLHGLPITIKDAYEVKGMPASSGSMIYKNHYPETNADLVDKLINAGAIIYGKTNLPYLASDWQTFNKVYGTTNNPWDLERTPGGSSGGSAASLASGFTSLEVGSDLNGSVRIPAHFCGVYGHRVTQGIVSLRGHIPGNPGDISVPDLAAAGLLARKPQDLDLLLNTVAGPSKRDEIGWKLELPNADKKSLTDYKVIAWLDDEFCPIDNEIKSKYISFSEELKKHGASVNICTPKDYKLEELYTLMLVKTGCVVSSSLTSFQSFIVRLMIGVLFLGSYNKVTRSKLHYLKGMLYSHRKWQTLHEKILHMQKKYIALFDEYDVLLVPVAPWTAFKHNHKNMEMRSIIVNGKKRGYTEHIPWVSIASLLGFPATSAPLGFDKQGLPINIQVISKPYMDKLTIDFCKKTEFISKGFIPPSQLL